MKTWVIVMAVLGAAVAAPAPQIPQGAQVVYLQTAQQPQYVPQGQVYYVQTPAPQAVQLPPQTQYVIKRPPPPPPPVKVVLPKPTPQVAVVKSVYKGSDADAVIISQSQDDNFDGNFNYNFETSNGINVQAVGSVKNAGAEDQIQVISGSYSYVDPDGNTITVTYNADENGFVAQGDHLPVPPPIPEAIARSLEYLKSLPPSAENQKK